MMLRDIIYNHQILSTKTRFCVGCPVFTFFKTKLKKKTIIAAKYFLGLF